MWGIKLKKNRSQIKRVATQMLERNHYQKKGYDQRLLKKYIWPFVQTSMVRLKFKCGASFCTNNFELIFSTGLRWSMIATVASIL